MTQDIRDRHFRYDRINTVLNYDMSNNIADRQLPLTNLYNVKPGIINGMTKTLEYKLTIRIEWRHF